MNGFSVVICCHNGARRLPATLAHLIAQKPCPAPWEVLLIDNDSIDNSAEVGRSCWVNAPAPLRIVRETQRGVRYARERGLHEARYAFIGFVDDDNWIAADWIRTAYEIMSADSSLGALGSIRTAFCEEPPPSWFDNFHSMYAILTENDFKQIQEPPQYLPTAGLCVRQDAWKTLIRKGFQFQLTGSIGKSARGGEDVELSRALVLSGWELRISQRLRLKHFIPATRLRWNYLRTLQRHYSVSDVVLDAYSLHSLSLSGPHRWLSDEWWYQLLKSLVKLAKRFPVILAAMQSDGEGRNDFMEIEYHFGRALGLIRLNRRYGKLRRDIRNAKWRQLPGYTHSNGKPTAPKACRETKRD